MTRITYEMQAAYLSLRRRTGLAPDRRPGHSPSRRSSNRLSRCTAYLHSVTMTTPQPCYQGSVIRRTSNPSSSDISTLNSRLSNSHCNSCRDGLRPEDSAMGQPSC